MLFKIIKIYYEKNEKKIIILCETIHYKNFLIEILDLESEITFEIKNELKKDYLLNEIDFRFNGFNVSTKEFKLIKYFDRTDGIIKTCNAYVLSWKGNNAFVHRETAMVQMYSLLNYRDSDFNIRGLNVDPTELLIVKLYDVLHHLFYIDDTVLSFSKPIPMTCDQLIKSAQNTTESGFRWCLITFVKKMNASDFFKVSFCDKNDILINITSALIANTLGKTFFNILKLTLQYSVIFIENKTQLFSLLQHEPFSSKIFSNSILIDKRSMPFFMTLDDFNKSAIQNKILPYSRRLATYTNLPLATVLACTTGAKLIDVYLSTYMQSYYGIYVELFTKTTISEYKPKLEGGYVTHPQKELLLYTKLVEFDFKGFYPSIIEEFNLDFESTIPDLQILPTIVKHFRILRGKVSEQEGLVLKFIVNNIYGTLGYNQSRFYCHRIAAAITDIGRREIHDHAIRIATTDQNTRVIFANTDGFLLQCTNPQRSMTIFKKDMQNICKLVNKKYTCMSLQVANFYTSAFIFATNNYICTGDGNTKIKGILPVHKTSPKILQSITDIYISVILNNISYPVGTKIMFMLQKIKELISKEEKNPNFWAIGFTVDKIYTRAPYKRKSPHAKVASDCNAMPGDFIQWLYVSEKNPNPCDTHPTFYTKTTAILREQFDSKYYDININHYLPLIVRCLQLLCSIYTAESSFDITDASFLNEFHPTVHEFSEKRLRDSQSNSYIFEQKILCNYCKKVYSINGYSHVINFLLKNPGHTEHISDQSLYDVCSHCHTTIYFWEYLSYINTNYLNIREVCFYTSIFSLLAIAKKHCLQCYHVIKQYKNEHIQQFHEFEQRLAVMIANLIPPNDDIYLNLSSSSPITFSSSKRIRIQ